MNNDVLNSLAQDADARRREGDLEGVLQVELAMLNLVRASMPTEFRKLSDHYVKLGLSLNIVKRFSEAEPYARRGLELRREHYPRGCWQIASAQSCLGGSLLGLGQYFEAEHLLRSAIVTLHEKHRFIPPAYRIRIQETVLYLSILYELTSRPLAADAWKARLSRL